MAIGDINSSAVGSGARYNDGKPPLELIPLILMSNYINEEMHPAEKVAMRLLGNFQVGGDGSDLSAALSLAVRTPGRFNDCARVFDYGRKKYAEWNWAKGMLWSIPLGCAARHLMAITTGEIDDPESGLPHWGHVACNIVMLLTYLDSYPEGDDRPTHLKAMIKNGE